MSVHGERTSDVPFPVGAAKKAPHAARNMLDAAPPATGAATARPLGPGGGALGPATTPGGFFAEHRALLDGRRTHLARMGMIPEHVTALRMPDIVDRPVPPSVHVDALPDVNMAADDYAAPKLPKLAGVDAPDTPEE